MMASSIVGVFPMVVFSLKKYRIRKPPHHLCSVFQTIDLPQHLAQGPLLHNHDHPSVKTKAPLQAAYRIIHKTIHQGQSILQSSITGILDSLRNRFRDQQRPRGSGPQFVVAEQVFRRDPREDVIRWRRLHGSLYKFGKAELYGGNTKFIDDRQAAAIVRRKSQLVQV